MSNLPDPKYIYHGSIQDGGDDLFVFAESGAVDEGCPDCERLYTADQMRDYAEEAVRLERERLGLPKSYGGSTFASWGDQKEGCTVRLHFKDAKEAEQWFNRLTDGWDAIRARSQEG